MKLSIISVSVTSKQSKAGKGYQNAEVVYKNLDSGKVENKNITQYSNVFKAVADAQGGQVFDVKNEKDDAGYWQWTSFVRDHNPGAATTAATATPVAAAAKGGTWETPEERAKKQAFIVKQSSIGHAVAMLSVGAKAPLNTEQVLAVAQVLVDYVLDVNLGKPKNLLDEDNDLDIT